MLTNEEHVCKRNNAFDLEGEKKPEKGGENSEEDEERDSKEFCLSSIDTV